MGLRVAQRVIIVLESNDYELVREAVIRCEPTHRGFCIQSERITAAEMLQWPSHFEHWSFRGEMNISPSPSPYFLLITERKHDLQMQLSHQKMLQRRRGNIIRQMKGETQLQQRDADTLQTVKRDALHVYSS